MCIGLKSMEFYLQSCDEKNESIFIPDNKTTFLGRSPETKISDKRCSRKQLEICATYDNKSVEVKVLGATPSSVNGIKLKKGESGILKSGETLHVIQDVYPYRLFIKNNEPSTEQNVKKRTISDFFGSASPKKAKLQNDSEEELTVKEKLERLQRQTFSSSATSNARGPIVCCDNTRGEGWYGVGSDMMIFESEGLKHSSKVVAFDMDSTLIVTKSGKTFPVDNKDWKIMYSQIPERLMALCNAGCKIVIITNQLGVGKGKVKPNDFKTKVEAVLKSLKIPAQVIAITKRGKNRKPNIGSWKWLKANGNGNIELKDFTYVGDAAGRPKNWAPGKKKDFSCGDRLFAMNLEVPFFTPEEFFLAQKPAKFDMPPFNPKNVLRDAPLTVGGEVTSEKQEVIIMVGYPASGKTSFVKNNILPKGYIHINRDTMKTWQKCVSACNQALAAGKCVVIDNTNPDAASRKRYIDCAKNRGCPCRCFVSTVSIEHAFHNNRFREICGVEHDIVPPMILYSFRKNYEEPTSAEGFDEIVKFNFVPKFENDEQKDMYYLFLD